MATSYEEVYCLNKLIKNDPRLSRLNPAELNKLRFGYLKFAISYFMYDCRKNLNAREDPSYQQYLFVGNGTDNEFELSPAPPSDVTLYIRIQSGDDVTVVEDYEFNPTTNIVTINPIPGSGYSVEITSFTVGSFDDDLDEREKVILAEGMNIPYIEESKNDQNAMKYIVTGKSLRFFSQANHIDSAVSNYNSQAYNIVDGLISEYSYKGSLDRYRGLAKRGRGV